MFHSIPFSKRERFFRIACMKTAAHMNLPFYRTTGEEGRRRARGGQGRREGFAGEGGWPRGHEEGDGGRVRGREGGAESCAASLGLGDGPPEVMLALCPCSILVVGG